ncbi:MAG: DUF4215 domain-containing protein [Acidobacteriota bacterium]
MRPPAQRVAIPALPLFVLLATLATAVAESHPARGGGHEHEEVGLRSLPDGTIRFGDHRFASWADYFESDFFRERGRCRTPSPSDRGTTRRGGDPGDCTFTLTNPDAAHAPSGGLYRIPVVFHVITSGAGEGMVTDESIREQVDILNEDFLALPGTPGEAGTDVQIEFFLATEDPDCQPTVGITRSANDEWFDDRGNYWETLAWDTSRYLNIYTNTAEGALGYVPDLPQGGIAGQPEDRVVLLWSTVGRDGPAGPPVDQGRTATHEIGHYFGLDHVFAAGGCGGGDCYTNGDLICDTTPQDFPTDGCTDGGSCGVPDNIDNYLDYSADTCMARFTPEQALRMRCTLEHYRASLLEPRMSSCGNDVVEACEECDDGNTDPDDGCDPSCQFEHVCGDGVLEDGEECDDGDLDPGDGCDENCELEPVCGNGELEAGEECDDGNTDPDDGCDENCAIEPGCGNGRVEPGEQCDDGNTDDGDGCDSSCQFEAGCCTPHPTPGCDDMAVSDCVCAMDDFCCLFEWDEECVFLVEDLGCGSCTAVEPPTEVSPRGAMAPLRFFGPVTLRWDEAAASGSDTFNLHRGVLASLRVGSYGTCAQPDLMTNETTDAELPDPGTGWFYLIGGANAGGTGPFGQSSLGVERMPRACP